MIDKDALRIIDANGNRSREALRVIEDIVRFRNEDGRMSLKLKKERHVIAKHCDRLLRQGMKGFKARDTHGDPGRDSMTRGEASRGDWADVLISNFRRAEEGLRVLEEVSKLIDVALSRQFKRSRFRVYNLEKACLSGTEDGYESD
ncbi:MAG: thiamine-phosphate pyrophosphorylase [Candidatus Eisenbacteria bacterium]